MCNEVINEARIGGGGGSGTEQPTAFQRAVADHDPHGLRKGPPAREPTNFARTYQD